MELTVLAFAHARETCGFSRRTVAFDPAETPRHLLQRLLPAADPGQWAVAVDREYVSLDEPLGEARELALIPPVSGG
jgi:molybdopterin synthase sulfur carrier subunit